MAFKKPLIVSLSRKEARVWSQSRLYGISGCPSGGKTWFRRVFRVFLVSYFCTSVSYL